MAFYKYRTELSNEDLFSLMSSLRKKCKREYMVRNEDTEKEYFYGDPDKPNIHHLSTWLPFNITI